MFKRFVRKPWFLWGTGLTMGLLIGVVAATQYASSRLQFPVTELHALATHGGDTMALATGPIADGTEGLFVLDYITGELQCSVFNPRTAQLGGLYKHNVVKDLGAEQGKQPKYLMVTGTANFRVTSGNVRPAETVVYIADGNTGRFVAYGLPWNRTAAQYNFSQMNPFIVLGKGSARNIQLEAN